MIPFVDDKVRAIFDTYPDEARDRLMEVRALIFNAAANTSGVGPNEETLKWREPAYLTSTTKSGSTIRFGWIAVRASEYWVYFNCRTNLVDTFRSLFPDDFGFEGNRAIRLHTAAPLPHDALTFCISAALTYHRNKKRSS